MTHPNSSGEQAQFNVPYTRRDTPTPMSQRSNNAMQINIGSEEEAQALAQQAAAKRPQHDPDHGWRPKASIAGRAEVTIKGGTTTVTSQDKTQGALTHYAIAPTRPGYIAIPGFGETPIAAARAGGLIPADWQEGDRNPFSEPAKVPADQDKAKAGQKEGTDKALSAAQHQAKVAGDILSKADQMLGAEATDAMLEAAVSSGEIPEDGLPQGVTAQMVKQVHAGYVAQANATLGTVGASVDMLTETLTEGELLRARRATMAGAAGKEELAALGQQAVARLAQMPKTDPEDFLEMVSDMHPAERKCLHFDNKRGEWMVNIPGKPSMSYGAAVHMGLIRI